MKKIYLFTMTLFMSLVVNASDTLVTVTGKSPLVFTELNGIKKGFVTNTEDVKKDVTFYASPSFISNNTSENFDGDIFCAMVDGNNAIRDLYYLEPFKNKIPVPVNCDVRYTLLTATPAVDAEEGDQLIFVSKSDGSDEYLAIYDSDGNLPSVPAIGNAPQTSDINFIAPEGVTLRYSTRTSFSTDCFYNGKPVIGFGITVDVIATDSIVRGALLQDGEPIDVNLVVDELEASYALDVTEESHDIEVKAFFADDVVDSLNIAVSEPGSLETDVKEYDGKSVSKLVLTGKMDQRDFEYLCTSYISDNIDMRDVEIVAYGNNPANTIPYQAFYRTDLKSIALPEGLYQFGDNAFMGTALKSIVIPQGVENMGLNTFHSTLDLMDVTMLNPTPVYLSWCVFAGSAVQQNGTLHVFEGCADAYRSASEWCDFVNIVEDAKSIYTGISKLTLTDADISVSGNTIRVDSAENVKVYNIGGILVGSGQEITVGSGLYVVKTAGRTMKIMIP